MVPVTGGKYAAASTVPVGRTRDEIERTLAKYGADGFMFAQDRDGAAVAFLIRDRHVRFHLPLPPADGKEFHLTPGGKLRTGQQAAALWQQAIRSRWRSLGLIIKAKLEAVDAGVVEFDVEFMPHLVLPDGRTVGDAVAPQLAAAIEGHDVPALMPGGSL